MFLSLIVCKIVRFYPLDREKTLIDFNPMHTNLDMSATNRIVNLALPVATDDIISLRAFWICLSNMPPMGDLSMGVYTNYAE